MKDGNAGARTRDLRRDSTTSPCKESATRAFFYGKFRIRPWFALAEMPPGEGPAGAVLWRLTNHAVVDEKVATR
jgi:hypothetical protein